jgi:hypothetical protein
LKKPKKPHEIVAGVLAQVTILRQIYPELNPLTVDVLNRIHDGILKPARPAEELIIVPDRLKRPDIVGMNPSVATIEMIDRLGEARRPAFFAHDIRKIREELLLRSDRTESGIRLISEALQGSDMLIISADVSTRFRNCAQYFVDEQIAKTEGMFGLGASEVGTYLLTHPNTLCRESDTWIICPGETSVLKGISPVYYAYDQKITEVINTGGLEFDPQGLLINPEKDHPVVYAVGSIPEGL